MTGSPPRHQFGFVSLRRSQREAENASANEWAPIPPENELNSDVRDLTLRIAGTPGSGRGHRARSWGINDEMVPMVRLPNSADR